MASPVITLTLRDGETRLKVVEPFVGADHAVANGACPECGAMPFTISGADKRIESHDTYRADGYCLGCRKRVGVIRATVSTLFGIEEDERVLNGRARVY